jgi:hypothetical protein
MSIAVFCDLRAALGAVRNQGRRPTCLAFAASAAHAQAHGYDGNLCVEWLYYHAVTRAGDGPQDGSTVEDTRAVIAHPGQPEEAFWPYETINPDAKGWRPPGKPNDLWIRQSAVCNVRLSTIRAHLDNGQPVVLALLITASFYRGWDVIDGEAILRKETAPVDPRRDYGHAR